MQSSNRLLDDLAKVASGAASAVAGVREEIEGLVRQRVERLIADLDLVSRDEFDVAKAMAAKARTEQEKLEQRVKALEAALAGLASEDDDGSTATTPEGVEAEAPPAEEGGLP